MTRYGIRSQDVLKQIIWLLHKSLSLKSFKWPHNKLCIPLQHTVMSTLYNIKTCQRYKIQNWSIVTNIVVHFLRRHYWTVVKAMSRRHYRGRKTNPQFHIKTQYAWELNNQMALSCHSYATKNGFYQFGQKCQQFITQHVRCKTKVNSMKSGIQNPRQK